MNWKDYSHLRNSHAFLSPSRHYWINYSRDKLLEVYANYQRNALGTEYHEVASRLIKLAIRLPNSGATFNSFVNDAIGFKMSPEVILYYSPHCYGTADAISYNNGILRIHDLKTGVSPGPMNQLLIYAALFCLDYHAKPNDMKEIHLRIYQNDMTEEYSPSIDTVFELCSQIVDFSKLLDEVVVV